MGRSFRLLGEAAELTLQLERYRQSGPSWQLAPQVYGDDAVTGAPKNFGPRPPAVRAFARPPYAPADLQLRFTLSGKLPYPKGLSYRASATFDSAAHGPYVVGPTQYASDATSIAALSPQRRASGFLGLQYVLR